MRVKFHVSTHWTEGMEYVRGLREVMSLVAPNANYAMRKVASQQPGEPKVAGLCIPGNDRLSGMVIVTVGVVVEHRAAQPFNFDDRAALLLASADKRATDHRQYGNENEKRTQAVTEWYPD
jgi:hypothetical protein